MWKMRGSVVRVIALTNFPRRRRAPVAIVPDALARGISIFVRLLDSCFFFLSLLLVLLQSAATKILFPPRRGVKSLRGAKS